MHRERPRVNLIFAPLIPWPYLLIATVIGVIAGLSGILRRPRAAILRALAVLSLGASLAVPSIKTEETTALDDIALILTDRSDSLDLGRRDAIAEAVTTRLADALRAQGVEVRMAAFGGVGETPVTPSLRAALADIPRRRLSAVFIVSDGQVHDAGALTDVSLDVPLHALITGDPDSEIDRRVLTVRAPRFGVLRETVDVVFRVEVAGNEESVPTTLYLNGEKYAEQRVTPGEDITLSVRLIRPGDSILELEVPAADGELTTRNNRAIAVVRAVRDRLRVLLVSGEPHAGERVWRNTLSSDPAVDLVHFTILKPADKPVTARREDLNLIEFPHQELFLEKLTAFDVVIFDRYTNRYVLGAYEFEEIVRYVEQGGALLIAAGPEYAGADGLAEIPSLQRVLPILPTSTAIAAAFVPNRTNIGDRHPVTAELSAPEDWGRWLRFVPGAAQAADVLLAASDDYPLLAVARRDRGRIAVLSSDHVWLWARGVDGGGPHRDLLRRLVHWLMQEPALEEEALRGTIDRAGRLSIERQSLAADVPPVAVTAPDGAVTEVELTELAPGRFVGSAPAAQPGIYRLRTDGSSGELFTLAARGEGEPAEYSDVVTTPARLAPIVSARGGGLALLARADSALPILRRVDMGARMAGPDFMGVPRRRSEDVLAIRARAALPPLGWLFLAGGFMLTAWLIESGRIGRAR